MTFQQNLHKWYLKINAEYFKAFKFAREILIATIVVIIGLISFFGYRFYHTKKENAAKKVLFECLNEYSKAAMNNNDLWNDVEMFCKMGFTQHASSKSAPFLLGFQADALLKQGKKKEALELLEKMLPQLSRSPVTSLYETKKALLKIDMDDSEIQKQGLEELQTCANDTHNKVRDIAQYYLGSYFVSQGEMEKAKNVWQQLIALNDNVQEENAKSPWARMAQERMGFL